MKKSRWLLEHFTSDELNELKVELSKLLDQTSDDNFPYLRELLEKFRIDYYRRVLNNERWSWQRWAKSERTSQ